MLPRLLAILLLFSIACQVNPEGCPPPQVVKLKKAKAYRMKYAMAKRKEAQANNHDYFREPDTKIKDREKIEEWDCPKPVLKYNKMMAKKARDLQRRYAQNLKKVEKESEKRTVMYGASDEKN